MTTKSPIENRKVLTPKFRVSFPAVFKPRSFESQEAKYSVSMLFPKNSDLTAVKKAVQNAITEEWGSDKSKWPKNLRNPIRDGDEKQDLQGYAGNYFVTATSKQKPGVVNQAVQEIIDESEFYAGCYARATVVAFAYDTHGNKGVGFALQNLQKLADGPAFSGRKKAEEEFDAVEDSSEDSSNYSDSEDFG